MITAKTVLVFFALVLVGIACLLALCKRSRSCSSRERKKRTSA